MICEMYIIPHLGSGDSSVAKYRTCDQMVTGFKSQQKQWVNLPQQHVKYSGHCAKSAGGRLQLNTKTLHGCRFE